MIFISFLALIIDQVLKLVFTSKSFVVIENFFNIEYVTNKGAAWSILNNNTFLLTVLTIVVLISSIFYLKNANITNTEEVIYGLILGGILGNLIDRIIFGYVKDFISFNIFGYHFPIFNFADIFITVGAGLLLINIIKEKKND